MINNVNIHDYKDYSELKVSVAIGVLKLLQYIFYCIWIF